MALLHRTPLGDSLDPEARELSKSLNVNHYLARMIDVPESLQGVWVFDSKSGPLPSAGSGECRASILGVLIALWEHSYSGLKPEGDGENEDSTGDTSADISSSGGARALAADGLKWILRFVDSLVDGATSVKEAARCATEGVRFSHRKNSAFSSPKSSPTSWLLSQDIQVTIQGMLSEVPKLWPDQTSASNQAMSPSPNKVNRDVSSGSKGTEAMVVSPPRSGDGSLTSRTPDSGNDQPSDDFKAKLAARKAAQKAAMEKMRKQQAMFAASLGGPADDASGKDSSMDVSLAEEEEESDECIICRCGAQDSDSPLGFLGHVQRSRTLGLRCLSELHKQGFSKVQEKSVESSDSRLVIGHTARVVGDRGCQLRASPAMDSAPIACLPMGSVVLVLNSEVSPKYDLRARRVFVRHIQSKEDEGGNPVEGWASIQSSQGYVILAPMSNLAFSRWGETRPVLRLCGHAAHLGCVDAHCTSLRQRADGDHPYDGRFAANIDDGEFLCPLCKQLSNVLLPQYHGFKRRVPQEIGAEDDMEEMSITQWMDSLKSKLSIASDAVASSNSKNELITRDRDAATRFSDQLYRSMQVSWDRSKAKHPWLDELLKWDYEEKRQTLTADAEGGEVEMKLVIGSGLQHLRELHISWALLGHASAISEASARHCSTAATSASQQPNASIWPLGGGSSSNPGETSGKGDNTSTLMLDPWTDYNKASRDTHPQVVDLKRLLHATCGVLDVVSVALGKLDSSETASNENAACSNGAAVVGLLLTDILDGRNGGLAALLQQKDSAEGMENWKLAAAYLASMPMHVSRDGLLSPRCQARANSAAMWVVRGCPIKSNNEVSSTDNALLLESPPMPFAPLKVYERLNAKSKASLMDEFGKLNIKDYLTSRQSSKTADSMVQPFLPALASGFLYMPLLAWDLNNFAAAVVSSLVHNGQGRQCDDLVKAAQALLIARLVQIVITPNSISVTPIERDFAMAEDWRETLPTFTKEQREKENQALIQFQEICLRLTYHKGKPLFDPNAKAGSFVLLDNVCAALLPFARSVVLLLRAGFSTIRARQKSSKRNPSDLEEDITSVLEHASTMTCFDALRIIRGFQCPLPSEIVSSSGDGAGWMPLIERWIASVASLESHHGSRGQSVYFDPVSRKPVPSYAINTLPIFESESSFDDDKNLDKTDSNDSSTTGAGGTSTMKRKGIEAMIDESITYSNPHGSTNESMEMNDTNEAEADDEDVDDLGNPMMEDHSMGRMGDGFEASFAEMEDQDSDSDEEMIDEMEGEDFFGLSQRAASPSLSDVKDDDETADKSQSKSYDIFADVADSAVIPYQPSLLAQDVLGPGPRGVPFDFAVASQILYDMSHLGLIHREGLNGSGIIILPRSFVELYSLVNKVKGDATDENDESSSSAETAICLLTGAIMKSGASRRYSRPTMRPPGACTLHARKMGSGIGIFFLVQKCTVLLMHNNKAAYSPSLYVDENGEEDPGLRRGRPLYLNSPRLQALESLWRNNGVPREVAQIRSTSDRVIRDNWY